MWPYNLVVKTEAKLPEEQEFQISMAKIVGAETNASWNAEFAWLP
jgi:hypothetical protein